GRSVRRGGGFLTRRHALTERVVRLRVSVVKSLGPAPLPWLSSPCSRHSKSQPLAVALRITSRLFTPVLELRQEPRSHPSFSCCGRSSLSPCRQHGDCSSSRTEFARPQFFRRRSRRSNLLQA